VTWIGFIAIVSRVNGSEVQGPTFSIKDKEGIEDPMSSLKIMWMQLSNDFQQISKNRNQHTGSLIYGLKKVDMNCKMHILFAN
jgi:hypothetical protein